MPGTEDPQNAFALRLKQHLTVEPSEYISPSKLLVLSDIEGNFRSLRNLLFNNHVVNNKLQWTFGDGHLVIVGDVVDRGDCVVECLWLIYSLEERAKRAGGYVHFILGNHEIMNLQGDWRYMHPKYIKHDSVGASGSTALYDGNKELERWLLTKNIVERVGNILFVHGGISPAIQDLPITIQQINQYARALYRNLSPSVGAHRYSNILVASDHSPLWYRGYYQQQTSDTEIEAILTKFSVNHIITGHTVMNQISKFFDGKVINVDTDHANDKSEALLIEGNRFYRVNTKGKRSLLS